MNVCALPRVFLPPPPPPPLGESQAEVSLLAANLSVYVRALMWSFERTNPRIVWSSVESYNVTPFQLRSSLVHRS